MDEVVIATQQQPVMVKEYKNQRVVTFQDIDSMHQRPMGTARRNFNENNSKLIEGEDYFHLVGDELADYKKDYTNFVRSKSRGLFLFTKMGYLLLTKSFNDDLAWSIQRQLVKFYFEHIRIPAAIDEQLIARVAALEEKLNTIPRPKGNTRKKQTEPRTWLRQIRIHEGKTPEQTAELIGVVRSYYAMIERGERGSHMKAEMAQKIATALSFHKYDIDWTKFFEKDRL